MSDALHSSERDRPATDLVVTEVTPEMVEVGLEVLSLFDPADGAAKRKEIVAEIYESMARRKAVNSGIASPVSGEKRFGAASR